MKHLYAKMTFRIILISFLALILIGCGESGSPGGSSGVGITSSISLSAGDNELPADGVTSTTITVSMLDSINQGVVERTSVIFRTNLGTFRNGKNEYKVKTVDESGIVAVQLTSDTTPGTAEVSVESNNVTQKIEVKFYNPHKVGTITLRTGSGSITADGTSQVSIIATVTDAQGNKEEGARVTFKTSLGQFIEANPLPSIINRTSTVVTDVDGEATVMLLSGTTIGTATILASLDGLNTSTSVLFTAGEPATISLRAAPSTIKPNGNTDLYAKIIDINGNPVQGQSIVFSEQINMSDGSLSSLSAVTNVNGEAQVTYSAGINQGADIIQAALSSDLGMKASTTIIVDPGAIVINGITVTAGSSSLVADGKGRVNIRAVVTDIDGNPAIGKTVNFTATAGILSSASAVTSDIGLAEVMLKSTTISGPVTVSAECDGFIERVSVEFIPGPADHILMYAFPDVVAPNGTFQTAAIVQDQYDNRIDDQRLMLKVRNVGSSKIIDTAEMTPDQAEDGVYRFDWTAAFGLEDMVVTASVNNGVSESVTVEVDETATIVGSINVIAGAEEIKADGTSSVVIRATVRDSNGQPASGITVDFSTTLGSLSSETKETDQNGVADVMLKAGTNWGTATVSADANGFWGEVDVRFTTLQAGGVFITTMPSIVQAGGQATVIAELRDANGSAVPNEVLYFDIYENSTGGFLDKIVGTTDTNGRVTVVYTAGVEVDSYSSLCTCCGDRIRVTLASDGSVSDTTCIQVEDPSLGSMTLIAGATEVPADGVSTTLIRAQLLDTLGNPSPGISVDFSASAGIIITTPVVTDSGGYAETMIQAPTNTGIAEITATGGGFTRRVSISYVSGAAADYIEMIATPGNLTADGSSQSNILIIVKDENDNPVGDETVTLRFAETGTGTLSSFTVNVRNGQGTVIFTAPSSVPTGNRTTILAEATNGASGSVDITLIGPQIAGITLTADPESLPADGISQSLITATLTQAGGGTVPDGTLVDFTIVDGGGSFAFGTVSAATQASTSGGVAIATLTSGLIPGIVTIQAVSGGRIAELEIEYTAGSVKVTIIPNSILGTGAETARVTVEVTDAAGDPAVGNVTLAVDDLSLGTIELPDTVVLAGGEAEFIFLGKSKGGTATLTATWDPDGMPNNGDEVSGAAEIDIQAPPAFIEVADGFPDPTSINIRGTGGQSTSQIVLDVKDLSGNPVADGYRVDFTLLDGPNGGEAIEPVSTTTSNGQISTILRSGFKSGPVSVKATYYFNTNVWTVTSQIAIGAGPPVGEEFGIFAAYLNVSGLEIANLIDQISVNVGDIYGNAVPDGTVVSFKTYNTGGFLDPENVNTVDGLVSSDLHSSGSGTGTIPAQGFLTVTAEANNGGRTTHTTCIEVDPNNSNIMYVGVDGGGVYKSSNKGASWTNVSRSSSQAGQNFISPYVNDISVKPDNSDIIYAATGYLGGGNIYRSVDAGITWRSDDVEEWNGLLDLGSAVLTIIADATGADGSYVWAGSDGMGAFYSKDGENFRWGGFMESTGNQSGDIIYLDGGGAGDAYIDINTFIPWATTKTEDWTVTYIDPGPSASEVEFNSVGTSLIGGFIFNTSTTEEWSATYVVETSKTSTLANQTSGYIYNVSSTTPNISSANPVETWTLTCIDVATLDKEMFSVESDIGGTDYPPAIVGTAYNEGEINFIINKLNTGAAYAFTLGDTFTITVNAEWEVVGSLSGLQNSTAETGTPYLTDGGELGFTISDTASLYNADDEFTFTVSEPDPYWYVVGSVSGIQDNKAYTLVPYASDNLEVSFTIAPGATPLADGDFFTLEVTESGLGYGRIVRDMVKASGSGDAAVLFAATATGVFKSTDGGQLWNEVSNFAGDNITTIAAHPDNPNTVYAGTLESGVYYATNAGSTNWMPVTTNGLGGGISATSPMADTNNIGTGIMSAVEVNGETNTQSENWTVVYNEGTALFEVTGSVSGTQADYNITTGVYTITDVLSFTISEGSVPFEDGDTFTFSTTRDPGTYIKDLLIYDGAAGENYLYAVTYFFGDLEPHAVGNVYGIDLRNAANNYVPAIGAVWEPVNTGLPQYDPPGDTTLFAQHVMALDNPASPGAMYIGGEGIHFYKATTDLATKNPQWFASESGLTNLIMSRMPILFTDDCTMSVSKDVKDLDGDGSIDDYRFKIYIEDNNGNPPIVGSNFTFVQKCGDEETTIANIDYPDAYVHQGTFRDIADPSTDIPYIYNFIDGAASGCEYKFSFTPTCGTGAPGCSGSNQELTLF